MQLLVVLSFVSQSAAPLVMGVESVLSMKFLALVERAQPALPPAWQPRAAQQEQRLAPSERLAPQSARRLSEQSEPLRVLLVSQPALRVALLLPRLVPLESPPR